MGVTCSQVVFKTVCNEISLVVWKKVWKEIRKGDCREAANDWSWSPALKRSKKRMPQKEKLRGSKSEKCAV